MPIWWRASMPTMSSKKQPNTRPGTCDDGSSVSTGSRSDHEPLFVNTRSSRSSRNGIHPTWLSEKAIFRCGKRRSVPDSSQSAIAM